MTARLPLALVTGANRGLGLEVCRQLRDRGYRVILTARDPERGREAARDLGVEFLPLDVGDSASVARLVAELRRLDPEGLDVVVANAGVALDGFDAQVAATTVDTNYFGVLRVVEGVLPLLRQDARLVLVSSGVGQRDLLSADLRARLDLDTLTRDELSAFMQQFVDDVQAGRHREAGWPGTAYGTSKIGVTALAHLLARDLAGDPRHLDIVAVCPGWVRTAMGGPNAERTVEVGAASILGGLEAPRDDPHRFYRDGAHASW
ncbi:SDR family NAD(P)-dependent oxidoreductase [Nannocystis bainbridge]|uniref:SDR family NAD(P)-dependent oxidoreductase n=1 Tax=Nannocystis bainbridge TaxID=2995303 RepID=A0ABT5DRU3_9BACT|nr:SDR family NAD(P)-dependent oxidoreductase [Nannocystis bainbridge]MDC0716314.1 SDR family NAD(P)-dependent oxidoreductase [Nannocystis bainbridge]